MPLYPDNLSSTIDNYYTRSPAIVSTVWTKGNLINGNMTRGILHPSFRIEVIGGKSKADRVKGPPTLLQVFWSRITRIDNYQITEVLHDKVSASS